MSAKTRLLLTGHAGFYNRGCEAIVRTTVPLLREHFPECEIALSSNDADNDRLNPTAAGIEVLDVRVARWSPRWLARQAYRVIGEAAPSLWLSGEVVKAINRADAVLQIGGDNFTSDYALGPESPLIAVNRLALASGRPLVFWGVSVGPFTTPQTEDLVLDQMRRAALITVRESISRDYLREHDVVDNVVPVADTAMLLEPEPVDLSGFWPAAEHVLAVNVSPLSCRYREDGETNFGLRVAETAIREVLARDGWGALLLPHVMGKPANNDAAYLDRVLQRFDDDGRVRCVPGTLNCAEAKYVISRCDALVAARTHATIAGFSSGVPTISLAYSRKSHGINLDLFGHREWLLDIVKMSDPSEIVAPLRALLEQREQVRAHLEDRSVDMRRNAAAGAAALVEILGSEPAG